MSESDFYTVNHRYEAQGAPRKWPTWELQAHGSAAPAPEPAAPEDPAGSDGPGCPLPRLDPLGPWCSARLTFADGARIDVLVTVSDDHITVEDVRADPPLALDSLADLARWIEGPLDDAFRAATGRPRKTRPAPRQLGPAGMSPQRGGGATAGPERQPGPTAAPAAADAGVEEAATGAVGAVPGEGAPHATTTGAGIGHLAVTSAEPSAEPSAHPSADPSAEPSSGSPAEAASGAVTPSEPSDPSAPADPSDPSAPPTPTSPSAPAERARSTVLARSRAGERRKIAADAYRQAQREGRDPVLAVMLATGRNRRRSLRLIAGARDEGLLTPRHNKR
ncbi:DUF6214 family protein [Streptomyces inhibens]|uniref:DUF6214 family protein n=1 Tax=Streptomyces inhibens TaxID=2293571 RepID=UPI0024796150|nr:DUF6214 family protein [Streptomyces inhibens]UKY54104.1 DUF6214 family protein [Streptomyces inhibens]